MRILVAAAALTVLGAATACSTEAEMRAVDRTDPGAAADAPSGEAPRPVPDGDVRTSGLVTVLDDGDGPEMCLGAVAASSPPQCSGPALAGFDWGDAGSEEAGGVRWGSYALTGTFDGSTFTVGDAIPAALYDTTAAPEPEPLAAACDEPTTTDTAKATPEDLDATLAAASALPSYASAWLTGDDTVNVAVTDDAEGAEAELRRTWGGKLCVTTVERTDADLNEVNQELQAALGDQLLTSGSTTPDSLDAQVVFDDGSIQEWADATYGDGLVQVGAALVPAG
jgi:hypothetical protein